MLGQQLLLGQAAAGPRSLPNLTGRDETRVLPPSPLPRTPQPFYGAIYADSSLVGSDSEPKCWVVANGTAKALPEPEFYKVCAGEGDGGNTTSAPGEGAPLRQPEDEDILSAAREDAGMGS